MSLESTSKLRNNIKDLKQKVDHQENVVSGYEGNYESLRNEVKLLLKLVELNKKLEHESDPKEITKLNNQKQEIFNKIPTMVGADGRAISQAIRDRETLQEEIHNKIDTETEILNNLKMELKDNKAMEGDRSFFSLSKKNLKWLLGVGALATIGGSYILSGKNKDKNKDPIEQTTPVAPPKDSPKDDEKDKDIPKNNDKAKEKPDNTANYEDGLNKKRKRQIRERDKINAPEKERNTSPNIKYRLTNPDNTKELFFDSEEERTAFARAHNLNTPSKNSSYEKDTRNDKVETNNRKAEWKLTSPDGKQTKTFNTKEERDAFARAHNIIQIKQ